MLPKKLGEANSIIIQISILCKYKKIVSCEKKLDPSLPLPYLHATCLTCAQYLYISLLIILRGGQATSLKDMMPIEI